MNVLEKAEKSLEYLKSCEGSAKGHELQAAAGTLGRCMGVLGSRPSCARHYANLLHTAIPTLLALASNDSAEVRLVGDEALNRAVAGGLSFHSYKTNIILQNEIDPSKNARWIRAALSRICLGDCWLRPGVGKIRSQAQTLFPKLSQIVRQTSAVQLTIEALEANLPRILNALNEYTTDDEITELSRALLSHVECSEPAVRRGISGCVAHLCKHRPSLLTSVMGKVFEKLWPSAEDDVVVIAWFCVVKAVFQLNDISKFAENDLFTVQDYLELYQLCIHYIEVSRTEHNIQNAVLECLGVLLSAAGGQYRRALLDARPRRVCLDDRRAERGHRRNISYTSAISSLAAPEPLLGLQLAEPEGAPELLFSGALHLGSVLQLATPSLSVEDLRIQTPDSAVSDAEMPDHDTEQLTKELSEKLQEFEEEVEDRAPSRASRDSGVKINIGTSADEDVPLKYCARLLSSKFLLTGNKGGVIPDRSVRVSVKSSALSCLSAIFNLYPQAATLYLDKDADIKFQNYSASSEGTDSNQDNINEFILERNVCFQDSITESLSQELFKSTDSQINSQSLQQASKKDSKSLEKSMESELKSSKEAPSNILDSKLTKDLVGSGLSADSTNPNMTCSNFTTNSNMTGSNDRMSTGYPMTSSADVLSSSLDLDMKFDHFGESATNLDNLDLLKDYERKDDRPREKRPLKRTDEVKNEALDVKEVEFECQHVSEVFGLYEGHNDPQIRGLVRVCIGNYLSSALDVSHGDYHRWRYFCLLPKEVGDGICTEKLVEILLQGLSDDIHTTVNHTLSALSGAAGALCSSAHWALLAGALGALVRVETNNYWLCRVALCRLYERLPYRRLFILCPEYYARTKLIMDALYRLLGDQDQKVRAAAAQTIANIIPKIYIPKTATPVTMMASLAREHSRLFTFAGGRLSLELARDLHFHADLPPEMRGGRAPAGALREAVGDIAARLVASHCKHYTQGLLETLQAVCRRWSPWKHPDAFAGQGLAGWCLDTLDLCNNSVGVRAALLDVCRYVYPVEIQYIMRNKTTSRDIFERDSQGVREKWQHLESEKVASLAEKFLQVALKMLNVLVHLIEEVHPNVHLNKSGIALPGSPVRRKTQDSTPRKSSTPTETPEDRTPRKRPPAPATSLKANFAGHFYTEPFYMKLYETLRATFSNHKINLDPKNSIFHEFLTTVLNSLAIQLELATEREFGAVTEEILYYLKVIMPYSPENTVNCVTQLLKCLFGTNTISQYSDFMSIADKDKPSECKGFFEDVMLINPLKSLEDDSRRSSVNSNASQKLSLDTKNPRMVEERQLLMTMENFAKYRVDRKWSMNKRELERYIRLFEPVVIQSLKSYTMQNDIPLQCSVLRLLCQLLALRVNYCMLDSDQVFIGFLMKQLELVEQHEIPNCCDLVNSILTFLVQLSSSKHHTKQLIEIPKLIQLCDGLMASGAHAECIAGLEPVAIKVFSNMGEEVNDLKLLFRASVLGRAQQEQTQATREVLFYMLQKTMHQPKVLDLVSCVLCLSQEHPESYYRWSELASDTLLNLLSQRSVELDTSGAIESLERLIDSVYRDVLLEQSRVEILLKILFKAPPEQATTPRKLKLRYLSIIMVLLRKVLVLIPESEILLSINYLKSTCISPQSIFFNVKPNVDPLNVQNFNENCANLSPDVILVRFIFKTLTYAVVEMDDFKGNVDPDVEDLDQDRLLYSVVVNIIVQAKHMMHLTNGCLFPLTAKTAQTILHNEQSGLNTGLYNPAENIPLSALNLTCLRAAHRVPLLTAHWAHLLIRLNFLSHKFWHKLTGFARNLPLMADGADAAPLRVDPLQTACACAYCEYFMDNGMSEAVHLSWLLVNRVQVLVSQLREPVVGGLLARVQAAAGASGLLLQAVAARCQPCLKGEFALNTYKILSQCHESNSGPLVFLICRIIGKLQPAIALRFAKLAIDRCKMLKELPEEKITAQLSKEDVQVALELLQRDKVHIRYATLVSELNALASTVFDLSPLDVSQHRPVNAHSVLTTTVDGTWLFNQIKNRCCQRDYSTPKPSNDIARLLTKLNKEQLGTVMMCSDFDRRLLYACFKVAADDFIRELLAIVSVRDLKESEIEIARKQTETQRHKEESTSVDSNKLNVVNSLQVFKKSDSKESKSQFFIPITDNEIKDRFGNLEISDEENEINLPELPDLYEVGVEALDKSLGDILHLFPKQSRPLSQSETFNLGIEQTIDRYTRRCHQVFQDKLFYQEFITIQTMLTGFLDCFNRIVDCIDEADCDLLEKCMENILPSALVRNLSVFSVMSLQYLSFLIKNKNVVESPVHADVSFRANPTPTAEGNVCVDHVIMVAIDNVARALRIKEIWLELNSESNFNRTQSAISCLYAIVKYLVKDTKPLVLNQYMRVQDAGPKPDIILTGDKLVTLIDYWERNFYSKPDRSILGDKYRKPIESLLGTLSRLEVVTNIALIPPMAWPSVEVCAKKDQLQKIDLPLQAFQDMDVLEAFLFRVNLIGWSSKKQFEEMWVGLLGALGGNGPHWAVRGLTQLLVSAAPRRAGRAAHVPRTRARATPGTQRLRSILVGTRAACVLDEVNLERVPFFKEDFDGYFYAQFSTEYLKLASELSDEGSFKVRREVKRKRKNKEIDINSCLQLLMDITADMLEPKAPTGLAARTALLSTLSVASAVFSTPAHWRRAATQLAAHRPAHAHHSAPTAALHALAECMPALHATRGAQEITSFHQKLLKPLSSGYAPLRQAALQGCLVQLTSGQPAPSQLPNDPYAELIAQLNVAVTQNLRPDTRISLYEQSLYWAVLFTLVELGHPDLMTVAVDFLIRSPKHYCADVVVRGITFVLQQQILPKDLKDNITERILENLKKFSEDHAVQMLIVHLFSADSKLINPKLESDVSNMDPDVLMSSMVRITLLYKVLQQVKCSENQEVLATALKCILRETLPPAATLSRAVIEMAECCRRVGRGAAGAFGDRGRKVHCAKLAAEVVFEVFETAVAQDQLPVLSGWIFEALCHLLSDKLSPELMPYCLLVLLVCASPNRYIRDVAPLAFYVFRSGFSNVDSDDESTAIPHYVRTRRPCGFSGRRLLCVVATRSQFAPSQLARLRELCGRDHLADLARCLDRLLDS